MTLDDLFHETSEWLRGTGPNAEIVMSSRVRLARNVAKMPFAHWASDDQERAVLTAVEQAIEQITLLKGSLMLKLRELATVDRQFLVERHLMSREHAVGADHKGLIVSEREIISIMVNEEDHLRLQVIQSGFNLSETWHLISQVDDLLSQHVEYAFSTQLGYLTACPTNTGTGMRASVMLHLPCLVMTKQINKVLQAITKLGLTARGFYGEGTQASGNFFQISNQVTLGQTEEEIIENIERIIRQVIDHEENARKTLMAKDQASLADRVWRAYGTLQYARSISSSETIDLLSSVRLGVDLGMLANLDRRVLNDLSILTQPAHLQKMEGKVLESRERDIKRATLIRSRIHPGVSN